MNKSLTIIVETSEKTSTEYLFVETLCRKSGIKIKEEDNFKIIRAGGVNNLDETDLVRDIKKE